MYPHSPIWHYLWVAPHVLQVAIVVIMIRRRLVREFPVFLTYTIFQIVIGGSLFVMDHSSAVSAAQYINAQWVDTIGSVVLRFALIYEIFSRIFDPYPALAKLGRLLFRWGVVVLMLVAVVVAAYAPNDPTPFISGIHVVNCAVSLMQCGLLVFLFLFSSYFGLSWRNYVYGIAAGLGIFSSVNLATAALRIDTGAAAGSYSLDFVTMATYHCCVLIWLVYMLAPETARRGVKQLPDNNLEQWNTEMQRLLLR
jgi:hypothetical protein